MTVTQLSILHTKSKYFEHVCSEYDVQLIRLNDDREKFVVYEAKGEATDIFIVGLALGIEVGEQIMYDACMKLKDN
jgi:hypothetical protein